MNKASLLLLLLCGATGCSNQVGTVTDAETSASIQGAILKHNGRTSVSDKAGRFKLSRFDKTKPVAVKAVGYRPLRIDEPESISLRVEMSRLPARGLFLSQPALSQDAVRQEVLRLVAEAKLNTLVVDVKGENGLCTFENGVPLAGPAGALSGVAVPNIRAFIAELHQRELHVVGRIVVFKDNLLAKLKPEWAVGDAQSGGLWRDGWTDPYQQGVWRYNVALAREAAQAGFDEILFDYVRFPTAITDSSARYSKSDTTEDRREALTGFLETVGAELASHNVSISITIPGSALWSESANSTDLPLETALQLVDYVSPILSPKEIGSRTPSTRYRSQPYSGDFVQRGLDQARSRTPGNWMKLRPWLENPEENSYSAQTFGIKGVRLQIMACEQTGVGGWLLWDSGNQYTKVARMLKEIAAEYSAL